MSALVDLRSHLAAGLAADARLAGINVLTHGGDFRLDDLKRYGAQAPAVVLALLGFEVEGHAGAPVACSHWALVCLTKNMPGAGGNTKHVACIALADAASRSLWSFFNYPSAPDMTVKKPSKLGAVNEYSTELDRTGIAMWGIAWDQKVDLADEPAILAAEDLSTVAVDYDLYPRPAGEDLGDALEAQDEITGLET